MGAVHGADTNAEATRARDVMKQVKFASQPVRVRHDGALLLCTNDAGRAANEVLWSNLVGESALPAGDGVVEPTEEGTDEIRSTSSGGNSIPFNEFKDVATQLAGIVARHPHLHNAVLADLELVHVKFLAVAAELGGGRSGNVEFGSSSIPLNTQAHVPRGGRR